MSYKFNYHKDTLTIIDGADAGKLFMEDFLKNVKAAYASAPVFKRSIRSLKYEWVCHNFAFRIGYKKAHTKDVDLDYPCDRPEWLYIVFGWFAWLFIK